MEGSMEVQSVTQCRLCGARFTEYLEVAQDGRVTSRNVGHPLEDANAWCAPCKERMDHRASALLETLDRR